MITKSPFGLRSQVIRLRWEHRADVPLFAMGLESLIKLPRQLPPLAPGMSLSRPGSVSPIAFTATTDVCVWPMPGAVVDFRSAKSPSRSVKTKPGRPVRLRRGLRQSAYRKKSNCSSDNMIVHLLIVIG